MIVIPMIPVDHVTDHHPSRICLIHRPHRRDPHEMKFDNSSSMCHSYRVEMMIELIRGLNHPFVNPPRMANDHSSIIVPSSVSRKKVIIVSCQTTSKWPISTFDMKKLKINPLLPKKPQTRHRYASTIYLERIKKKEGGTWFCAI